jgi:tripartite-type tricarboxylate transporter receptor subunit TctC
MLVVNPTVPARTVKEFVALATARAGKLTYGSSGTNGSLHLGGELLSLAAGIKMVHVPYKGAILSLSDVMGGHIDAMFIAAPAALAQVKSGKVRALAVASRTRAPYLNEVPTFAEAGYPDVKLDSRYGIMVAGATPRESVARLYALFGKVLEMADVRERYAGLGMEAAPLSPQDYATYLREDLAKWRKVAAAAKLQLQ